MYLAAPPPQPPAALQLNRCRFLAAVAAASSAAIAPRVVRGLGASATSIAQAIQTQEGWFPGSTSYRNNNPGNLMYAGQAGAIGQDANGFAVFPDSTTGFNALVAQVQLDQNRGYTISQLANAWAPVCNSPACAGNDPTAYAQNVANAVGLSPSDLLTADTGGLVSAAPDALLSPLVDTSGLPASLPWAMAAGLALLVFAALR